VSRPTSHRVLAVDAHHSGICRTSTSFTFTTSPKRIADSIAAVWCRRSSVNVERVVRPHRLESVELREILK
jgi:hypothetical protein